MEEITTKASEQSIDDNAETAIAERFRHHGFACPLTVLTAEEASQCYQELREYERIVSVDRSSSSKANEQRPVLSGDDRFRIHLLLPWAWDLVHHPVLVRAVQQCLGTADVWCWSTDLNIKESESSCSLPYYAWHQDAAFAKIDPPSGALTAWIALTCSDVESGCLYCIPGSHLRGELPHAVGIGGDANVLAYRQEVKMSPMLPDVRSLNSHFKDGTIADKRNPGAPAAHPMVLEAGQASIHSFLMVHASPPNRSQDRRRIGLAIRYVSAHCRRKAGCSVQERATLVSGDGRGLFEPECEPLVAMGAEEKKAHAESLLLERRNYLPEGQSYR